MSYDYYRNVQRILRVNAIKKLGGACNRCGCADYRVLEIDHILGEGSKEKISSKRRCVTFYRMIIRGQITDLQILCANCHLIKKYECFEGCLDYNEFLLKEMKKDGKRPFSENKTSISQPNPVKLDATTGMPSIQ